MRIPITQAGFREQAFVFFKRIGESNPFDGVTYGPHMDRVAWEGCSGSCGSYKVDREAQASLHAAATKLGVSTDEIIAQIDAKLETP
jgi:hypothetical protein